MASQVITLNTNQAKLLVDELYKLDEVKKNLLRIIPESYLKYGSDLWWQKSDLQAQEDINNRRFRTIKSHRGLDKYLDGLK